MPEYDIIIENRAYRVDLARKKDYGVFEAKVNGRQVLLELERDQAHMILPSMIKVEGKTYRVELEKIVRHSPFILKINGVSFKAELKKHVRETITKKVNVEKSTKKLEATIKKSQRREGVVVAPMAGKIVSIKVRKGDSVKTGDVLCILEAMKMENEILASKTGKVQEINLTEGKPVRDGDILVVIK